ncbi:MAG: hypothetical protein ACTSYI_15650 [Promethearchaeota archaeon]
MQKLAKRRKKLELSFNLWHDARVVSFIIFMLIPWVFDIPFMERTTDKGLFWIYYLMFYFPVAYTVAIVPLLLVFLMFRIVFFIQYCSIPDRKQRKLLRYFF